MFRVTINDFASYKIDNFIMSYFRVSLDLLTDC